MEGGWIVYNSTSTSSSYYSGLVTSDSGSSSDSCQRASFRKLITTVERVQFSTVKPKILAIEPLIAASCGKSCYFTA